MRDILENNREWNDCQRWQGTVQCSVPTRLSSSYHNPWLPLAALNILRAEGGPILDVGGGVSPYVGATHILDLLPFDATRLSVNAWGDARRREWTNEQYTQWDISSGHPWPFADRTFALGLCSHTLEDLRDPLPALAELGRVCRQILVITPSRLAEQTRGIDHPRYCGFFHHPWAVSQDAEGLVFRRKTANLELPGCHLVCAPGWTLPTELGVFLYHGPPIAGREEVFWSPADDAADYRLYLEPYRHTVRFVRDSRPMTIRRRVYVWRQKYLGVS
jgi:SAM-dependent methyltransferase